MWKKMTLLAAAMWCIGCVNNNSITIENYAAGAIDFSFRAQIYQINPGEIKQLPTDIPNGTYEINIGAGLPPGTTSFSISPGGANFIFKQNNTKYRAEFGSTWSSGTYTVTWNYTSTDDKGTVTGP
jgi:hypothetical protein